MAGRCRNVSRVSTVPSHVVNLAKAPHYTCRWEILLDSGAFKNTVW